MVATSHSIKISILSATRSLFLCSPKKNILLLSRNSSDNGGAAFSRYHESSDETSDKHICTVLNFLIWA